jgi:O-antigen ligase
MTGRILTYVGAGLVLVVFLMLATAGPAAGIVAVGLVLFGVALICFGPEAVGITALTFAFGTAPMYKGLAPEGTVATPTDLCLVVGFGLLLPRLLRSSIELPARYVLAVAVIVATGIIGSLASTTPALSFMALAFWLATVLALPTGVHLWRPTRREVQTMAWAFVIGHLVSTVVGYALGHVYDGRLYGLTNHPNYFAESGVITFGLLLHLVATTRRKALPTILLAVTVYTVYMSGSRAGTLALAAVVLLIPVVERSALKTYLLATLAAAGALVLSLNWSALSGQGSLGRLTGQGSAAGSDQERTQGFVIGWHRFLDHPLTGSGLVDLFDVHNNYLEAAIGIGIFGLLAFLVVLWTLGAPLFGSHDMRRICYTVVGYAVFGATTPALYDRTYWVAMSLSIVVVTATHRDAQQQRSRALQPVPRSAPPGRPARATATAHRTAPTTGP